MSTELVERLRPRIEGTGIWRTAGPDEDMQALADELAALTAKVAEAEQRIAALMSERSSLIATKAEQLVALTKRATEAEAALAKIAAEAFANKEGT